MIFLIFSIGCSTLSTPSLQAPEYKIENHQYPSNGSSGFKPESEFELSWPVKSAILTQKICSPYNPKHDGIDLAAQKNTPIFSAHEGMVIYAGRKYSGYGKMVIVEYNKTWATLYAHFDRIKVKMGQPVQSGQLLGFMGRTGRATGVHLHFELLNKKIPVDPMAFLPPIRSTWASH